MSKKYIVELIPEYADNFKGLVVLGVKDGDLYMDSVAVDSLEELSSDYINEHYGELQDEAYQRGVEDGAKSVENWNNEEKKLRMDEAYQRGLEDAWEAARKIVCDDSFDWNTLMRIFDSRSFEVIFGNFSASEAVARLRAYEENKDDSIKVGDEVVTRGVIPDNTFLVTKVTESTVYGISNDGSWNFYNKNSVTKTGKHYDIQSILEAMRT